MADETTTSGIGDAGHPEAEATLFCGNCGAENPATMRFCGNCGKPLVRVTVPVEAPSPNPSPADGRGESGNGGGVSNAVSSVAATDGLTSSPLPLAGEGLGEGAATADAGLKETAVAIPTPTPTPAPAPTLTPTIPIPTDPIARERERDRLLTLANVQRMRGQMMDARQTLENALFMAEGKATSPIYELIGDMLAGEDKWADALDAYDKAHQADAARVSAERKFAAMTLRLADAKAERSIADAMLRGDSIADLMAAGALEKTGRGKRNAGMAMFLSCIFPGFGQFYNGEILKGMILVGIFLADLLLLALTPDRDIFTRKIAAIFALSTGKYANQSVSPLAMFAGIVLIGLWLYSIVDAPFMASKTSAMEGDGKPAIDKTGWEV